MGEKERSRMSASLLVPLHSNPRRGRGNVEDGNEANNHQRTVYLRKETHCEESEEEETQGKDRNRREEDREREEHTEGETGERESGGRREKESEGVKRQRGCSSLLLSEDHFLKQMLV